MPGANCVRGSETSPFPPPNGGSGTLPHWGPLPAEKSSCATNAQRRAPASKGAPAATSIVPSMCRQFSAHSTASSSLGDAQRFGFRLEQPVCAGCRRKTLDAVESGIRSLMDLDGRRTGQRRRFPTHPRSGRQGEGAALPCSREGWQPDGFPVYYRPAGRSSRSSWAPARRVRASPDSSRSTATTAGGATSSSGPKGHS